ncbi:DNA helicase [Solibacillus sp. FSL H8-0538]|uniref:DNA helicase n=1 Tax=Solibacillus sp. FSL H8-0538 TaxID=2921400 RepID=UPI0030F85EF7
MINEQLQKNITKYIEQQFFHLTAKADVKQLEQTIQKNITMKKESSTSQEDFYDRLMLNITYYVENKAAWTKVFTDTYGTGSVPKISYIENELIAQQMRIRQFVSEKMDDYKKVFHSQYKALKVTEDAVIYDYAYASVEHSLRFDFLTYVTLQKEATLLAEGDVRATLKMIDGYIAYYADQFVNKMELV